MDPLSAHFHHIVGAAFKMEEAVLVFPESIARPDPGLPHRFRRLICAIPVARCLGIAAHPQNSALAARHRLSVGVGELHLISGHSGATGSEHLLVEAIGKVDMQNLGRSQTLDDSQPCPLLPFPEYVFR